MWLPHGTLIIEQLAFIHVINLEISSHACKDETCLMCVCKSIQNHKNSIVPLHDY